MDFPPLRNISKINCPDVPVSLDDARKMVEIYIVHYNNVGTL